MMGRIQSEVVMRGREQSLTPEPGSRWGGVGRDSPNLSPSGVLASLEIPKPIVPRVLLTLDKLIQLAHPAFAGATEFQ